MLLMIQLVNGDINSFLLHFDSYLSYKSSNFVMNLWEQM